jgi:antitoxin component of MazEF toxin-antitoxin module
VSRTFKATLEMTTQGQATFGKIQLEPSVVDELGLRPGEAVRAQMRGTDFTGKVHGSMKSPGLLVPLDVISALGLREGQGVRITVLGRP